MHFSSVILPLLLSVATTASPAHRSHNPQLAEHSYEQNLNPFLHSSQLVRRGGYSSKASSKAAKSIAPSEQLDGEDSVATHDGETHPRDSIDSELVNYIRGPGSVRQTDSPSYPASPLSNAAMLATDDDDQTPPTSPISGSVRSGSGSGSRRVSFGPDSSLSKTRTTIHETGLRLEGLALKEGTRSHIRPTTLRDIAVRNMYLRDENSKEEENPSVGFKGFGSSKSKAREEDKGRFQRPRDSFYLKNEDEPYEEEPKRFADFTSKRFGSSESKASEEKKEPKLERRSGSDIYKKIMPFCRGQSAGSCQATCVCFAGKVHCAEALPPNLKGAPRAQTIMARERVCRPSCHC
jgi:hypothetical protein